MSSLRFNRSARPAHLDAEHVHRLQPATPVKLRHFLKKKSIVVVELKRHSRRQWKNYGRKTEQSSSREKEGTLDPLRLTLFGTCYRSMLSECP